MKTIELKRKTSQICIMGLLKEAVPLCLRKHLQIPYPDVEKILAWSNTLVTV